MLCCFILNMLVHITPEALFMPAPLCVCADLQTPLKSHTALWRWSFISLVMEHLSWSFSTSGSSALPKAGLHPCPGQVKPGTGSTTKDPLGHATALAPTPHLEKLINTTKC